VQLLQDAHQRLRSHHRSTIQIDKKGYKSGPLPEKALKAFFILQKQLTSKMVMAFPKSDRQYTLITDAATGTADTPGGLGPY